MKIKNVLFLLFFALATVCCKPEETKINEGLRTIQRANVRMEIKEKDKQTKKEVGIVGDSAAVKNLARWGYFLFSTLVRPTDPSMYGRPIEQPLDADNWAFGRDTAACIYIFNFNSVFDYGAYEIFLDGSPSFGVPGTERPGWLLTSAYPVFVGYYDTIKQRYKDPMIASYLDSSTGYWVYPEFWLDDARADTMGYIPQSMIEANYPRLRQLYDEGRYSEMVDVMRTGYTIYTCTGEEYRELVRLGIN